jgi:hypothetical protein
MTRDEHLDLLKRDIAANLAARLEHHKRQERAARGKPVEFKLIWAGTPEEEIYLEAVIGEPHQEGAEETTQKPRAASIQPAGEYERHGQGGRGRGQRKAPAMGLSDQSD